MKTILLTLAITLTSLINAQTTSNFKLEHDHRSKTIKIHFVNTLDFIWNTKIQNMYPLQGGFYVKFELRYNGYSDNSMYLYSDSLISSKNSVGDTVATLHNTMATYNYLEVDAYFNKLGQGKTGDTRLNIGSISFTDFLTHSAYLPCYASVGPKLSVPTVHWESIEKNNISKYIIKRNKVNIDTVLFTPGILNWTDSTNTQSLNFTQTYTIEAVDSLNNKRSGDVTTIHARNLASVDGNVEMDWTLPTTAKPITQFNIYEYKVIDSNRDTLILINSVPSNILQYTVTNPKPKSSYLVGVSDMNCSGTSSKSYDHNLVLSNKVRAKGVAGISTLSFDKDEKIIGYYDLLGRKVDSTIKNQLFIVQYESGRTEKLFIID